MSLSGLRIIAVSPVGGSGGFNTSIHRVRALQSLGCHVTIIDSAPTNVQWRRLIELRIRNRLFRLGVPIQLPDIVGVGRRLLEALSREAFDVIWLEKALMVTAHVLITARELAPKANIVGFSPDDMAGRHNQSQQFLDTLSLCDVYLTTKSYNVSELRELGCPAVRFVANGYDPEAFRPIAITTEDELRLGADVGFIGSYEAERAATLYFLAKSGLHVRVWGEGWGRMWRRHPNLCIEGRPLLGDEFAKACAAFKINLGFLRKLNRDLQTTRSVEIPACGGFMLAERTNEHLELFAEGKEAEFFETCDEILEKCRYYLAHPLNRQRIAQSGYRRCLNSHYSNAGRLAVALPSVIRRPN